jgi:hypothetical protein
MSEILPEEIELEKKLRVVDRLAERLAIVKKKWPTSARNWAVLKRATRWRSAGFTPNRMSLKHRSLRRN